MDRDTEAWENKGYFGFTQLTMESSDDRDPSQRSPSQVREIVRVVLSATAVSVTSLSSCRAGRGPWPGRAVAVLTRP